jgi:predicted lipid carrier protein YhbT
MPSPKFVATLVSPLRLIPDAVHSRLLAATCNHLMRGLHIGGRMHELDGKTIRVSVSDVPMNYSLTIRGGRLYANTAAPGDACITGRLVDFWLLATRAEDPDTLFFNRRLVIEGDTETGLYVKNLLDGLEFDWQAHFRDVTGRKPPVSLVRAVSWILERVRERRRHRAASASGHSSIPASPYQ